MPRNPPVLIVRHSGDHWTLNANGHVTRDLDAIQLSVKIVEYTYDGEIGELPLEDDFCNWALVTQNGEERCPPEKGPVTINFSRDLPSWRVEEVS